MSFLRQLRHGFRALFRVAERDSDIDAELRYYFEEATAAHRDRGLSEEEARRAARRECGNLHTAKEQVRTYGWENILRVLIADLRFAGRQLLRNPGFAAISILTRGVGVGASTAIFSAINPVLFKPLPYPRAGRILMIWNNWQGSRSEISFGTYLELSRRSHSFEVTSIFEPWLPTMTSQDEPHRLEGQSVRSTFFRVLGVHPYIGRDFRAADEGPHAARVVVIGNKLWHRLYHADPAAIGQAIKLDGDNYTVIGVMPGDFDDVLSPSAELWTPDQYDSSQVTREFNGWAWGNHIRMIGRLQPGVSRDDAAMELAAIARTRWPQFPRPRWASLDGGLIVNSLQDDIVHTVRPALLAVFGAVLIVLAIASVNLVNLLLARSARRAGEFSVRGALGASRRRILRQLLTESMLLTLLGGGLGIAIAIAGVRLIVALSPSELPRLNAIRFDPMAFLFASTITAFIGIVAGLVPALHILRSNLQSGLRNVSRRIAGTNLWTRRSLVIAEVSLAFVLSLCATLLLRSMQRLMAVDPGFSPSHLLTLQVVTSGHQFDDLPSNPTAGSDSRRRFFEQALQAVRQVPGVDAAAFTSLLPLSDDPPVMGEYGAQFDDQAPDRALDVFRYAVDPGYCQTMRIPLLSGRFLDQRDTETAPQSAMITESLARRHFGNRNPIGARLHIGPRNRPWYTVVGIVGNVKQTSMAIDREDAVYLSTRQTWFADDTLSFVIRARGNATDLVASVKSAIWSVDKNQPIVRISTMDRLIASGEAERLFILMLFEAFAVVALLLAAVGLYGVLSQSISERMHEIGIRMALGASRGNILTLALQDGLRLTAFGIAVGVCGALAAGRAIASLLFGTSSLDPLSWLAMSALLAAVAVAACWIPARRGSKVDPATTLRAE